ncbi:hypothetical protein BX666DRAFT_218259, partial [Dichotomocladium elegans]
TCFHNVKTRTAPPSGHSSLRLLFFLLLLLLLHRFSVRGLVPSQWTSVQILRLSLLGLVPSLWIYARRHRRSFLSLLGLVPSLWTYAHRRRRSLSLLGPDPSLWKYARHHRLRFLSLLGLDPSLWISALPPRLPSAHCIHLLSPLPLLRPLLPFLRLLHSFCHCLLFFCPLPLLRRPHRLPRPLLPLLRCLPSFYLCLRFLCFLPFLRSLSRHRPLLPLPLQWRHRPTCLPLPSATKACRVMCPPSSPSRSASLSSAFLFSFAFFRSLSRFLLFRLPLLFLFSASSGLWCLPEPGVVSSYLWGDHRVLSWSLGRRVNPDGGHPWLEWMAFSASLCGFRGAAEPLTLMMLL